MTDNPFEQFKESEGENPFAAFAGGATAPGGQPKREPSKLPTSEAAQKRRKYDFPEMGAAAGTGAVAGALAPELTFGAGMALSGLGSTIAPRVPQVGAPLMAAGGALEAAYPYLKSGRALSSLTGLMGSGVGEALGQTSEVLGAPRYISEGARIGGGLIPPGVVGAGLGIAKRGWLGELVKGGVDKLVGETKIAAKISDLEKKELANIMGELKALDPNSSEAEKLFGILEKRVADFKQRNETAARDIERGGERAGRLSQLRIERGRAGLSNVGDPQAEYDQIGRNLRSSVVANEDRLLEARDTPYGQAREVVNGIVNQKQSAGNLVESTEAYQNLLADLRRFARVGKEGEEVPLAMATGSVEDAYRKLLNALERKQLVLGTSADPTVTARAEELAKMGLKVRTTQSPDGTITYIREYPTSYEALDDTRRMLGKKASFGEPATGFEALEQKQAETLYKRVRDIQREYVGEPFDAMQALYSEGTGRLEPFMGKRGQKAVGIDLDDPSRYRTDPDKLAKDIFGSRQGFDDFLRLSGNDLNTAQKEAANYIARNLRDKTSIQAEAWLNSQEFLKHPALQQTYQKAVDYYQRLRMEEELSRKGASFAARQPQVAEKTRLAAEKEAQAILGSDNPIPRIKDLILKGDRAEWDRVGPLLTATQEGRQALSNAVPAILADKGKSAAQAFREDLAYSLRRVNMDPSAIQNIQTQLDRMEMINLPQPQKLNAAASIIQKALINYLPARAVTGTMEYNRAP